MSRLTYGQLEDGLRSIGFVLRGIVSENKWFEHPGTGAVIVYPELPLEQPIWDRHRVMVRSILEAYGHPDPFLPAEQPQQAG